MAIRRYEPEAAVHQCGWQKAGRADNAIRHVRTEVLIAKRILSHRPCPQSLGAVSAGRGRYAALMGSSCVLAPEARLRLPWLGASMRVPKTGGLIPQLI